MTKHSKVLTLFLAFSFVLSLAAIAQQAEETVVCPVSGKEMKKSEAKVTHEYQGKTYYFCCEKDEPGKCPECGMKLEKKMMHKEKMEHKEKMMHKEKMHAHMHKKAEEKQCCPMMGMMSCKDIEVNVENTKDGIVVKVTSKNEEFVKKIQEMAAKMKECCKKEAGKEVKKEVVKK